MSFGAACIEHVARALGMPPIDDERELSFAEFETDCLALAHGWLPGARIKAAEFDYGLKRGVAAEWPDGARHAVRGVTRTHVLPWYWRYPFLISRASRTRRALTPANAVKALRRWRETYDCAQWEAAWEAARQAALGLPPDHVVTGRLLPHDVLNSPGPGDKLW